MPTEKEKIVKNDNTLNTLSADERYWYVYDIAQKNGDKFPEIVAAQFALETGWGKSVISGTNNLFNQKTNDKNGHQVVDANGNKSYWKVYDSIEESIIDRATGKWAKKYESAKDPISALAMIQPNYAPHTDGNDGYISKVAQILKARDFYKGDTKLPNADKNPDYYKQREMSPATKHLVFKKEFQVQNEKEKERIYNDYTKTRKEILDSDDNENLKKFKLKKLDKEQFEKGYVYLDENGKPAGPLNEVIFQKMGFLNDKNKSKETAPNKPPTLQEGLQAHIDKAKNRKGMYPDKVDTQPNLIPAPIDVPSQVYPEQTWIDEQKAIEDEAAIEDVPQSGGSDGKGDGGGTTKKDEIDPSKIKRMNEEADSHFSRFVEPKELDIPDTWKYDPKNYKKELPLEALAYGAMGLMGMGDAKTPLPERTDEISEAILSYTANLKRMSEMGLKPEEEAKLKDDLAGAYQEGIDQLVRASNGNRNVVLGNMGTLNKNRLDAIGNMAVMDVMKKDAAYEKYGKALEYVQNFNTTKAMDNHKIKLDAAKEKRAAGAALASTGFSSMLAELQHQKDNGPGSINHQYMKSMMVQLTGIDSDIKDKGDGSQPFTVSYNKRLKEDAIHQTYLKKQEYNKEKGIRDQWAAKPTEEKNKYDNYMQFVNEQNKPEEPRPNPFTKLYQQMKPVNYVERYDPTQDQAEVPKPESVYPLDEQFPYFNNTVK
jgi:hypothetical protein